MSESEKPFTVKDRRHFTPDGRVREEPEAGAEPDPKVDEAREPGAETPFPPDAPPSPPPPSPESRPPAPAEATEDEGAAQADTAAGPADFGQFVLSLGAQAGLLLAGQGLPEGTDPAEALAGARSIIAILEMLEIKTEGNRTPQDTQILEGLLFELRMAYVEKTRGGGS